MYDVEVVNRKKKKNIQKKKVFSEIELVVMEEGNKCSLKHFTNRRTKYSTCANCGLSCFRADEASFFSGITCKGNTSKDRDSEAADSGEQELPDVKSKLREKRKKSGDASGTAAAEKVNTLFLSVSKLIM